MRGGRLYIVGIGASTENIPNSIQSQVLLATDRIAMVNPANGSTEPTFAGQGDQILVSDVFLKRLTAPIITSGGNPPALSLAPDGKLTVKGANISGNVNADTGAPSNVTVNKNYTIKGMLEATQVRSDFVKTVSKSFPGQTGTRGNAETPDETITVTISDDHDFDRQIIIPSIIFNEIAYDDPRSGNNPGGTRYAGYGFEIHKNSVLIAPRETKGAIPSSYSTATDMPSGRGNVTLEFKAFHRGNQRVSNITDCAVIVTKKAASGVSIRQNCYNPYKDTRDGVLSIAEKRETIIRKPYTIVFSVAICLAVSDTPAWASEHQPTLSAGYPHTSTDVSDSDDFNETNVKHHYELTDTLRLVTSFGYAGDRNRQPTRYSDTRWHEDSVRSRRLSAMAGSSVHVNEQFSAYAMAGIVYSHVSTFPGDCLRVTDNKGKTRDVLTGSDDGRHSSMSLAWGAGVQFNPTESVAIDIVYEGSGNGDWCTGGFIVGVGYKL